MTQISSREEQVSGPGLAAGEFGGTGFSASSLDSMSRI